MSIDQRLADVQVGRWRRAAGADRERALAEPPGPGKPVRAGHHSECGLEIDAHVRNVAEHVAAMAEPAWPEFEAVPVGLDADPAILREFLRVAGAPGVDEGPLPDAVARGVRRAQGGRSPSEARPALDVLRGARVPSLVVSGDHTAGLERICDALATALDGERVVAPGAGHFVAAAPGFAEKLEQFLRAVRQAPTESPSTPPRA